MSLTIDLWGSAASKENKQEDSLLQKQLTDPSARPVFLDQSLLDHNKASSSAEPTLSTKEGEREEITTERLSRGNAFHVNRAARDSKNESLYARRLSEEFKDLGEDLERTLEKVKELTANNKTIVSIDEIATTLSNLRDRLTVTVPSSVSGLDTSRGADVTNLARDGNEPLHRIATETQMSRRPEPLTFMDDNAESLIQNARGSLHDISSSLSSIEARLVANCGLSPFGNQESLQQLHTLRLVKERVEEVDQRLRDMQST